MDRHSWGKIFACVVVALSVFGPYAHATWPDSPTENVPIFTGPGDQGASVTLSDGAGGAIIVFVDGSTGQYRVFAQRVDSQGVTQWAGGGVQLSTLIGFPFPKSIATDGAGGAIVAWSLGSGPSGDDVYVQRVDATGATPWGADGVVVCAASGGQFDAVLVSDGAGGAIVAWSDWRSAPNADVYAQRVDASGTPQWTPDGVAITFDVSPQHLPTIVTDGAGGAIIGWSDHRSSNRDIYAQRVAASGVAQWAVGGVAVCTESNYQQHDGSIADGSGGAIFTWRDARSGAMDVFAQRLDASGLQQWAANGVAVCAAAGAQDYSTVCSDGTGGAILTWSDPRDGDYDVYAQRVDASGNTLWTLDGATVCTVKGDQFFTPRITSDDAGGAVIAWPDTRSGPATDIYAQRMDATGARLWPARGVAVSTAPGYQGGIDLCPDGLGGAILAWTDGRDAGVNDVYAQAVGSTGTLDGSPQPPSTIAGHVTAYCLGAGTPIAGLTVDAFAVGSGDLLGTDVTDTNGDYSISDLPGGDYTVTIVTPPEFSGATLEQPVSVVLGDTATADFDLTCLASYGDPRSSQFWKHQFGVATGGNGNADIGPATLCTYLDIIEAHFNSNALNQVVIYDPPGGSTCPQKLEIAKVLLNLGGSPAPIDKAKQQLFALLLNIAANYLALNDAVSKDGATASQAVTYCDQIIDNPSGNFALAASIADKVNMGQQLKAGVIPLSTQNIAYRGRLLEFSAGRNPASGPRTFRFALSAPAKVDLSIYDVQGRRVARVYAGPLGEGSHVLPWSGAGARGEQLGRGVYFSRLSVGDQTRVEKLVQTTP